MEGEPGALYTNEIVAFCSPTPVGVNVTKNLLLAPEGIDALEGATVYRALLDVAELIVSVPPPTLETRTLSVRDCPTRTVEKLSIGGFALNMGIDKDGSTKPAKLGRNSPRAD